LYNLLNVGNNAKTIKGDALGQYLSAIMYLAPAMTSGHQMCPSASVGCKASCLFSAGRGAMSSVEKARVRKTNLLMNDPAEFTRLLVADFDKLVAQCAAKQVKPCVRLNGTSDTGKFLPVIKSRPDIQFYDYSKEEKRMREYIAGKLPTNYHLTFSRSETNWTFCKEVLQAGKSVAAVFDAVPPTYEGFPVVSGDDTDLRFLDPEGVIIGLKAKGKALKDVSGFVIRKGTKP